ncbi:TM2 domain-containing protein [Flavobacterium agricola]|uniref:TM2 domain-containing protein n=1 Tax=Flavobacterium agricola TaxID=2870839 RepID=A0ABY6LY39_9FLAO|nr:TM2 domain-containing protein [Flavobacterium agricola]UYW01154.1 TM2 domain-containing protein [Flavobacterium agricola]
MEHFNQAEVNQKKVLAGIFGIILGSLAIHKFYLGYTKTGIIQLLICIITCGAGGILGLIEGILYLTKSDEEFYNTYIKNKKEWF